ncbi:MAG: hypothetical protein AB7R87_26055 [Parvibaculaceae bacterium]
MARRMTLGWRGLFVLLAAAFTSVSALAEDIDQSFIDHLQREIVCLASPDPTATLLYLSRHRHIDAKKGDRADGESCWVIYPPLKIDGIAFTHICASGQDPLLIELYPLFYYRGPGPSPGMGLRLITKDEEAAADDWLERAKKRLGLKGEPRLDIGEPTFVAGKTEISCNSRSFLGGE